MKSRRMPLVLAATVASTFVMAATPLAALAASTETPTCHGKHATIVVTSHSPHTVEGTHYADVVVIRSDGHVVETLGGNDTICGSSGHDVIHGGGGNDYVHAYGGNDLVFGDSGDDTLSGGTGNDHVEGGSGNDSVQGADGDDLVVGGTGDNTVSGGSGHDTCRTGDGDAVKPCADLDSGDETPPGSGDEPKPSPTPSSSESHASPSPSSSESHASPSPSLDGVARLAEPHVDRGALTPTVGSMQPGRPPISSLASTAVGTSGRRRWDGRDQRSRVRRGLSRAGSCDATYGLSPVR